MATPTINVAIRMTPTLAERFRRAGKDGKLTQIELITALLDLNDQVRGWVQGGEPCIEAGTVQATLAALGLSTERP